MADYSALVLIGGIVKQIHTPDNIVTGSGLKNESGDLAITPAGSAVSIAAGKNLIATAGAGAFDFSAATGLFKTSTGAVTVGGSGGTATFASTSNIFNNVAYANGGLDRSTAAALAIGATNATEVSLSRVGQLTRVYGDFQVDGAEVVVGTTTLTGDVLGDLHFREELNHSITIDPSVTTSTAGGNLTLGSGTGSAATGATAGAAGGTRVDQGGVGGAAAAGAGAAGAGGAHTTRGGVGGAGSATGVAGAGGSTTLVGGAAGANGGAGGAAGGAVVIDGGAASGAGTAGAVTVGGTTASSVGIGRSGITTTVTGGLTQLTGAWSLTGNAASSATTTTGAITFNGKTIIDLQRDSVSMVQITSTGAVVQAGAIFSTTGTGNINLPNNASARFQVEGVAVSANVTSANLGTLTAGVASNADTLHTHAGLVSGATPQVTLTGQTTTAMTGGAGQAGYVSANETWTPTDNAVEAKSYCGGFYEGTASSMCVGGVVGDAKFTTAGGSPSAGAQVYLAAASDDGTTGAGKLTATVPAAGFRAVVGLCLNNTNYAGAKTAKILIQVKEVFAL